MTALLNPVPAPPEPVLGGWTLRPLTEPEVSQRTGRTYSASRDGGGTAVVLRLHRVLHHPLRASYPFGAHDLAVNLVVPEPTRAGQEAAARLLHALVPALFAADPYCRRVVAAPDEDDAAMQLTLETGGFHRIAEADLPDGSVVLFAAEPDGIAGLSTALDDMPH
ncbi:GNAT family N-acetyltransferase [Streptomyces sp. NPDC090493]|uniref:GNAT family N-acetyltransferase n=1 Tax=Streptomyces sp. NPDC090493 TaxID=3365964 RepID=UPI0037F8C8A0